MPVLARGSAPVRRPGRARVARLLAVTGAVLGVGAMATVPAAGAATKPKPATTSTALVTTTTTTTTAAPLHFGVVDGDLLSEAPAQITASLQKDKTLGWATSGSS